MSPFHLALLITLAVLPVGLLLVVRRVRSRSARKLKVIAPALLNSALEEQVRRELAHTIDYRTDQRLLAIQQRLSRSLGKEVAFSKSTLEQIQKYVDAHAVLGPWHRE